MHLDAANLNTSHLRCALVKAPGQREGNAKLVFMRSGGDVGVRVRIDVGINAQRDRRPEAFIAGNGIDVVELGLALDVKTVNALVEGVLDFVPRFSHSSKCAFRRRTPRSDHSKKFASGNNIKSSAS